MSFEQTEFIAFWTALENYCDSKLPTEIKPFFQKALEASGFFETQEVHLQTFWNELQKCNSYEFPKDSIERALKTAIDAIDASNTSVEMPPPFKWLEYIFFSTPVSMVTGQ